MKIYWRSRTACDQYYDYFIEKIEFVGGNSAMQQCLQHSGGILGVFEAAVQCLLKINPADFDPQKVGDCATNWRVVHGPCWKAVNGVLSPCEYLECCVVAYRVCINEQGEREVTRLHTIKQGVCEAAAMCEDICTTK